MGLIEVHTMANIFPSMEHLQDIPTFHGKIHGFL